MEFQNYDYVFQWKSRGMQEKVAMTKGRLK